jgi:hypothetical protein
VPPSRVWEGVDPPYTCREEGENSPALCALFFIWSAPHNFPLSLQACRERQKIYPCKIFSAPPAVLIYNIYIEVYILYNKTYKYTYLFVVQGGRR